MAGIRTPAQSLAPWLWLLLFLFSLRVLGQMLVVFAGVEWLPPMSEWMSGLMPYPYLLISQFIIIGVYAKVAMDFTRGAGCFVRSRPVFGGGVLWFGVVYFTSMIVRYGLQMMLRPETRWFGGAIPIVFHFVLASFIILFALWHRGRRTIA